MLQSIQDKSVHLLETIIERLEEFDQLKQRPRVFGQTLDESDEDDDRDVHNSTSPMQSEGGAEEHASKDKLKNLNFELIDIGLHSSQLAVDMLQQTEIYQGI